MATRKLRSLPLKGQPRWFKGLVRGFIWLGFGGCDVQGLENVPKEGPFLIASTHRSYLDALILGAFIPRILNFMAKSDLFENPFNATIISAFGAFPVDRESVRGSTFRTAINLLRSGEVVVIFPEGGIVNTLGEQGFKAGVGMLAALTRVPVLPVYLAGTNTLFSWPEALSDTPWMALHIGKPILPDNNRNREARDRISEQVVHSLLELERNHLSNRELPVGSINY